MKGDIKWRDLILQICILGLVGLFTLWAMYGLGRGGGNKTFVYDPFAFIRSLIDDPNHFFRREIALARTYLEAQGKFSPRLILLYGAGILMFYVVNFGTRIVSLSQVVYGIKHRNLTPHQLALWITITIVSIVPLFFVQNGDWFNTMQFLYYGVFLASFPAGEVLAKFINKKAAIVFVIIIVITLIPLVDMAQYPFKKQMLLSQDFLDLSEILRNLPQATIAQIGQIPPDSRLSAFSGKPVFFADESVLKNTGISPKDILRRKSMYDEKRSILGDPAIVYAVIDSVQTNPEDWSKALYREDFREIYSNASYILYQRNR
jgi:hypothetical protein